MFDPEPFQHRQSTPAEAAPGLAAWAEWETFLAGRDREIADHLGVPLRAIRHARETNMAFWEWCEYRLNTDSFDDACRLSAAERKRVRELEREAAGAARAARPHRPLSGWDRAMVAFLLLAALYLAVGQAVPGFWSDPLGNLLGGR